MGLIIIIPTSQSCGGNLERCLAHNMHLVFATIIIIIYNAVRQRGINKIMTQLCKGVTVTGAGKVKANSLT